MMESQKEIDREDKEWDKVLDEAFQSTARKEIKKLGEFLTRGEEQIKTYEVKLTCYNLALLMSMTSHLARQ